MIKRIKLIYMIVLLLLILASFFFSITKGLAFKEEYVTGKFQYVTDSEGNLGSDDNGWILVGVFIFIIPLIIRVVRFKKQFTIFEMCFAFLCLLIQLGCLFLIEEGDIIFTIFYLKNFILLLWLLSYVAYGVLIVLIFIRKVFKKEAI